MPGSQKLGCSGRFCERLLAYVFMFVQISFRKTMRQSASRVKGKRIFIHRAHDRDCTVTPVQLDKT